MEENTIFVEMAGAPWPKHVPIMYKEKYKDRPSFVSKMLEMHQQTRWGSFHRTPRRDICLSFGCSGLTGPPLTKSLDQALNGEAAALVHKCSRPNLFAVATRA